MHLDFGLFGHHPAMHHGMHMTLSDVDNDNVNVNVTANLGQT